MQRRGLNLMFATAILAAAPPALAQTRGDVSRIDTTPLPKKPLPAPVVGTLPPPAKGMRRCIGVNAVAGAVVFGDSEVELTMKDGKRWRLYFAERCPTLTFYNGFYYRRAQAGQLCAGKDAVISRAGGECPIASIMPVRRPPPTKPKPRR